MKSVLKLATLIPFYMSFRVLGWPKMLPVNYTLSLLYDCNSRCLTCNVWMKHVKNFTVDEYDATFKSVGQTPFWFTLSGGEPFLRDDIIDIYKVIYKNCRPAIINIPTNASLYDRIPSTVEEMCRSCPETHLVINISVDGVGARHDYLRGFPGNFEKAMKTYKTLKEMNLHNLTIGIHSVISRFNLAYLKELVDFVRNAQPDSFITEIAEERVELNTVGSPITPPPQEYERAIDYIISGTRNISVRRVGNITRFFRLYYYEITKKVLKEKYQVIPCYAGWASCQISPDGDVWPCCIRGQSFGNLRKHDYDFKKVWFSAEAAAIRNSIRKKECYCTLANARYTDIFIHLPTFIKAFIKSLHYKYQKNVSLPQIVESDSNEDNRDALWIKNSRQRIIKAIRLKAGEFIGIDTCLKCLCGKRIIVQRGQSLPICTQCGKNDWWQPEEILE